MLSQFDLIVDRFSDNVDCTYEQISTRMEAGCTSTRYNLPNMTLTHVTALRVLLPIEKRLYGMKFNVQQQRQKLWNRKSDVSTRKALTY